MSEEHYMQRRINEKTEIMKAIGKMRIAFVKHFEDQGIDPSPYHVEDIKVERYDNDFEDVLYVVVEKEVFK